MSAWGSALPLVQRRKFESVAGEREQELLHARQENGKLARAALAAGDRKGAIDACWECVSTERRLGELKYSMGAKASQGGSADGALCTKVKHISRVVLEKPGRLVAIMGEIEGSHPWSQTLATRMRSLEDRLLQ